MSTSRELYEDHQREETDRLLREILHEIRLLRRELNPNHQFEIKFLVGENQMSATSFTAPVGSTFNIVPLETENGNPFTFTPANLAYVTADPTVCTVALNPAADGSATGTAVAAGTTSITCTDSVTGGSGVLTVTLIPGTTANTFDITLQATLNPASLAHRRTF